MPVSGAKTGAATVSSTVGSSAAGRERDRQGSRTGFLPGFATGRAGQGVGDVIKAAVRGLRGGLTSASCGEDRGGLRRPCRPRSTSTTTSATGGTTTSSRKIRSTCGHSGARGSMPSEPGPSAWAPWGASASTNAAKWWTAREGSSPGSSRPGTTPAACMGTATP